MTARRIVFIFLSATALIVIVLGGLMLTLMYLDEGAPSPDNSLPAYSFECGKESRTIMCTIRRIVQGSVYIADDY